MDDIVDQLRKAAVAKSFPRRVKIFDNAADEIERLRQNAKEDAQYLAAYHYFCQQHGISPSLPDLIAAMKESE